MGLILKVLAGYIGVYGGPLNCPQGVPWDRRWLGAVRGSLPLPR